MNTAFDDLRVEADLHPEAEDARDANQSHEEFPLTDWQYEVNNEYTNLDYWSWLSHQLECRDHELIPQPFDPFNL